MKKSTTQWILLGIFVILTAIAIRVYNLSSIPSGLTWDEVAIGYNGWSIWEIRRDEWLLRLPIAFKSFGDYKAPLAIYLVGFFTQIFGLNALAIRLPFAIAGSLAVAATGWLAYEWRYHSKSKWGYVVLSMAMIAFSPWHLHFSRAGFESGISLLWVILGLATWFRMRRVQNIYWLFLSILFFALSLYTYHSTKLVVPLLAFVLLISHWRYLLKEKLWVIAGAIWSFILLTPLLYSSLFNGGASRLSQTSVLSLDISTTEKLTLLFSNYLAHFTPSFLFMGDVVNARQGFGDWGILLPLHVGLPILFVIGVSIYSLYTAIKKDSSIPSSMAFFYLQGGGYLFPILLILIGVLPGSLGLDEVPHTIRTLLALPGYILFLLRIVESSISVVRHSKINQKIKGTHGEEDVVLKAVIGTAILIQALTILTMLNTYFTTFAAKSTQAFAAEYLPAMELSYQYASGEGKPKKDKIIITPEYGQPYIYILFANELSPIQYNNGILINYEFKDPDLGDLSRKNAVIFATPNDEDLKHIHATHELYGPDGSVRFRVFVTE